MISANEFWLAVHRLAVAYEGEGLTPAERATNIVEQFRAMPALAQREFLIDLFEIVTHCPDLYPVLVAAARE